LEEISMKKHTPGPWYLASGGSPSKPIIIYDSGVKAEIATIKGKAANFGVKDYGERLMNASLIASAPDLLQALKYALVMVPPPDMTKDPQAATKAAALVWIKGILKRAEGVDEELNLSPEAGT
jgi:hypothetical protein